MYYKQNELFATANLVNGIYRLNNIKMNVLAASVTVTSETWHCTFGHISIDYLNMMRNGLVDGLSFSTKFLILLKFLLRTRKTKNKNAYINGGEFCNNELEHFFKENWNYSIIKKTNKYTLKQNGMCERLNCRIIEESKCLMFDYKLEKFLG